jgi:hypothetical protein
MKIFILSVQCRTIGEAKGVRLYLAVFILILFPSAFGQNPWKNECVRTANLKIYSDAFIDKETGDLNGYELAIDERKGSTVDAFLYVYEGQGSEGIQLPGNISGDKLLVQGNWVEHLIESPSKKEIVQTHFVKISGTIESSSFRGQLDIQGLEIHQPVQLRRVGQLWMCKK